MKKQFLIVLSGDVQGIGLRHAVKRKADFLNLSGFVQNELNGSVTVCIEGEGEVLGVFLHWLNSEFDFPGVHQLVQKPGVPRGLTGFEVKFVKDRRFSV